MVSKERKLAELEAEIGRLLGQLDQTREKQELLKTQTREMIEAMEEVKKR